MKTAWNTGRLYQRDGQQIAAMTVEHDGKHFVVFTDISRMIDGTFEINPDDVRDGFDLQNATMHAYDSRGVVQYSFGRIVGEGKAARYVPLITPEQERELRALARTARK